MGVYTSPTQLMVAQVARYKGRVPKAIDEFVVTLAQDGEQDLYEVTQGPLSTKTLRKMGHPFGRRVRTRAQLTAARRVGRGGVGLVEAGRRQVSRAGRVQPLPINKQTGELRANLFLQKRGKNTYDIGSRAPHARFVFEPRGTKLMIPRQVMGDRRVHGTDGIIRKRFRARVQGALQVVRKANRSK